MLSLILPKLPTVLAGWPAYSLFYLLGFGLAGGLLLWEGRRRVFPLRPWLLLVAGTVLALIAGTRLIVGSPADWQALFSLGHWGAGGLVGRSVLGGMLAALLALAGLRRLLGFGRDAADAFALPFALGLAVQGVGCLLAGCCFGELLGSGPGLGVVYGPGSEVFRAQVAQGLLAATAAHSLPVHAAQLYQMLLCLGIGGGLLAGRMWLARRPGLALPVAFGLYAAGRFGLEFLRDPLGDVVGAGQWLGLKPVQWGLLVAVLALAALVAGRVRRPPIAAPAAAPLDQPLPNLGLVLLMLVLPPVLLPGSFDLGETLVLRALLLPVVVLEAARWLRVLRRARPLPALLLLLSIGLMSQAPAPTAGAEKPGPSLTFGLSGLTGSSYQLYYPPSSSCSGSSIPQKNIKEFDGYHQRFTGAMGSAVYNLPVGDNGHNTLHFGLNAFLGRTSFDPPAVRLATLNNPDTLVMLEQASARTLYDINPNVEFAALGGPGHRLHLRFGMGAHLSTQYAFDYVSQPLLSRKIEPSMVFEVGYRNIIWTHGSAMYGSDGVGNGTVRLGLGTSFGGTKVTLLAGQAFSNSNGQLGGDGYGLLSRAPYDAPASGFAEVRWQAAPAWLVESSALSNFNDVSRISLGARYNLPLAGRTK
ncbi:prolipoprotein diacylglyceryl transferase family protein [Hymenobacter terricola]|uniref:prolipoprotein diacylglyceryl transferase family protein n=1 Tax=Hymenobacter terricola TaxID=2819236 RepID=UPI001B31565B|nr:prolipoprotein diacylglyceryl transferase family protein [Hymenobacter terricola]